MALRETSVRPMSPWMIRWEIFAVFAVSLGASALNALLSLIGSLLAPAPLSGQEALLVGSQAQNHWLDLTLQLASVAEGLAPVVLVFYLLARNDESPSLLGIDASQPGKDAARGAALAAVIGGIGPGPVLRGFPSARRLECGARTIAVRLVARSCSCAFRVRERHAGRDAGARLSADPARSAWRQAGEGDLDQRRAARFLPPVPGPRRFPRETRRWAWCSACSSAAGAGPRR